MRFASKEMVIHLRSQYRPGDRVVLERMSDPYSKKLKPGCLGTVSGVDDAGTIFIRWDTGCSLGVVFGEDSCRRIGEVG